MPQGDSLARIAATLDAWLGGRKITAAASPLPGLAAGRLVGDVIETVDVRGKHLFVRLSSERVLHTHLGMRGSWYVYRSGQAPEEIRRPRLVLECDDRMAACVRAPVIELLEPGAERVHMVLGSPSPEVLADNVDLGGIRERLEAVPSMTQIGDVLLDQRVLAGIGNIYRCESLFLSGLHPCTPLAAVGDERLTALVATASLLMQADAGRASVLPDRGPGALGRERHWVYGRRGRPCRRCGRPISGGRVGLGGRTAYWCSSCQPLG